MIKNPNNMISQTNLPSQQAKVHLSLMCCCLLRALIKLNIRTQSIIMHLLSKYQTKTPARCKEAHFTKQVGSRYAPALVLVHVSSRRPRRAI